MDERGGPESKSNEEMAEFALLRIGVSFAVDRHLLNESDIGESLVGGPSDTPGFMRYSCALSQPFRAPLDLVATGKTEPEVSGADTDKELVLVRYILHNMVHGLQTGVRSGTPLVPKLSPVFSLDTSAKNFVGLLIEELNRYAISELSLPLKGLGKEAGLEPKDMAVYNRTSVLFVRDLDSVKAQTWECKSGKFSGHQRFLVMDTCLPIWLDRSDPWYGPPDLRSVIYIIEDPEVVAWAKGGGPLPPFINEAAEQVELAESRLASILAAQLLRMTAVWIRRQCIDALSEMTCGTAEETPLQHILKLTKRVGSIRGAHLQLLEFLSLRNRLFSSESTPKQCLLGLGEQRITSGGLKAFAGEIGGELTMIEGAIRDRLTFQSIETEQARQGLESKKQTKFNVLSGILGMLVIFEILAEFYSWQFAIEDPFAPFAWLILIVAALAIVILVVRKMPT